jgi:hypothetical protein
MGDYGAGCGAGYRANYCADYGVNYTANYWAAEAALGSGGARSVSSAWSELVEPGARARRKRALSFHRSI